MYEELSTDTHNRPYAAPLRRMRTRLRLTRRDRLSAELARRHGIAALLSDAETIVDIGWARTADCAGCGTQHARQRLGSCVVCALVLASPSTDRESHATGRATLTATLTATWQSMHRSGHRPVHWNPAVMHALQAHELRQWNDRAATTQAQVSALLRKARRHAEKELTRTRTAGRQLAALEI